MTIQEQQTLTPEELVGGETPQENFTITTSDGPPIEVKKRTRTVEDRLAEIQAERLARRRPGWPITVLPSPHGRGRRPCETL